MQTSTKQERTSRNGPEAVVSPAEVLNAYLEKSPIVQTVIRDLVTILGDANVPPSERQWAETALQDALFRHQATQSRESGRGATAAEKRPLPGLRDAHQRMEKEETEFAANLARLLAEKNVSQAELARRVGVGSSAISMMLSRRGRPQQRTVEKIAQALDVELRELWPG